MDILQDEIAKLQRREIGPRDHHRIRMVSEFLIPERIQSNSHKSSHLLVFNCPSGLPAANGQDGQNQSQRSWGNEVEVISQTNSVNSSPATYR